MKDGTKRKAAEKIVATPRPPEPEPMAPPEPEGFRPEKEPENSGYQGSSEFDYYPSFAINKNANQHSDQYRIFI